MVKKTLISFSQLKLLLIKYTQQHVISNTLYISFNMYAQLFLKHASRSLLTYRKISFIIPLVVCVHVYFNWHAYKSITVSRHGVLFDCILQGMYVSVILKLDAILF